jgi:hypothetical protein
LALVFCGCALRSIDRAIVEPAVPHHRVEKLPKRGFAGIGTKGIESGYPTQAKGRLEWGTQHLLPLIQEIREPSAVPTKG